MKKIYNKPELKSVKLMTAEALLGGSQQNIGVSDKDEDAIQGGVGGGILSNEEGAHDIWGNDGNGIW